MSRDRVALTLLALATTAGVPAFAAPPPETVDTARVLALDCNTVDAASVRDVLARARAPRIILVNGSLPSITLDPFARFLAAMGYPADRLQGPHDGALSISGYTDSARLAGIVAWYYERDGMAPILIGHSRGGMVVIKTLHELAGAFGDEVAVWDPVRDEPLPRATIVDPRTGSTRPVIGIQVPYAVALATGKLPRVWQGQWNMIRRLRVIPDTVRDFTGIRIQGDLIAGDFFGPDPYVPVHTAHVRNVTLPASYSHLDAGNVEHLAADPATRTWIESFRPDRENPPPAAKDTSNLLHAAEIWYGVRRAWCLEAQALQGGRQ